MVQDIDREQQVVIVHLTLVLPSYYHWPLILGLLPRHNSIDNTAFVTSTMFYMMIARMLKPMAWKAYPSKLCAVAFRRVLHLLSKEQPAGELA